MKWFLLKRFLFPERASLLTLALWICVGGVTLGMIQVFLVLSVFTGFQRFFEKSYTRISSEIMVIPRGIGNKDIDEVLHSIDSVAAVSAFSAGQGMVAKEGSVGGVALIGMDMSEPDEVTPWEEIWVEKPREDLQKQNPRWIWVGTQLAKKLKIKVGDSVQLLIVKGDQREIRPFVVTAITRFGIYDHDLRYARIDKKELDALFGDSASFYKVKPEKGEPVDRVAEQIEEAVGLQAKVTPWYESHRNVFLSVQHQKKMLFWVLEILVALAAVNLVSLLMMNAQYRKKDIAILRAMGIRIPTLFWIFLAQGSLVGGLGVLCGIGGGWVACALAERFQPELLEESVYNIKRLPMVLEWTDIGMVATVAFGLSVVFSILPALRAATQSPLEVLRYE